MIVDLDYIEKCKKEFSKIKREKLKDLKFMKGGKRVFFDMRDMEKYNFMGLNNTDIEMAIKPKWYIGIRGRLCRLEGQL
jgi:hypothetical protein